ncbi:ICP22 family protein [Allosalinactinospora lopnorensis]|uniref:hypothetical protein n=1 Tax=Allosalinactinospora lopnorensis TaxID=1352348 RepID=UPI00069741EA|nr:hypothetical protein [Allosalinactinospora lopnorensis]
MTEDEEKNRKEEKKGIDLSMAQVAGGGLATLSAATAASFLGVYGTIIGAAVMSVLSTAGAAVIQHFFQKSGDRAKGFAERARRDPAEKRSWASSATRDLSSHRGPGGAADADRPLAATMEPHEGREPRSGHDPEDTRATQAFSAAAGREDETAVFRTGAGVPDSPAETTRTDTRGSGATRAMPAVGGPSSARGAGPGGGGEGPDAPEEERSWWKRRGWKPLLVSALVVFGLVMLAILMFELFTGRSLTDTVQGRDTESAPTLMGGYSESGEQPTEEESEPGPDPEGQEYDSPGQDVPPDPEDPGEEPGRAPETGDQPEEPSGETGEQPDPGTEGQQDDPAEQDGESGQGGVEQGEPDNGGAAPPGGQYGEPRSPL